MHHFQLFTLHKFWTRIFHDKTYQRWLQIEYQRCLSFPGKEHQFKCEALIVCSRIGLVVSFKICTSQIAQIQSIFLNRNKKEWPSHVFEEALHFFKKHFYKQDNSLLNSLLESIFPKIERKNVKMANYLF